MENIAIIFSLIGVFVGYFIARFFYHQKLETYKKEVLYRPGTGKIKEKETYWSRNPAKARADSTIIGGLLDHDGISYKFARVVSRKLVPSDQNNGWGTCWLYRVEYWD